MKSAPKERLAGYGGRRPPRPEFSFLFVAIGMGVGMLAGFAMEVAHGKLNMLIMAGGSLAGIAAASASAAIRYVWQMRAWKRWKKF